MVKKNCQLGSVAQPSNEQLIKILRITKNVLDKYLYFLSKRTTVVKILCDNLLHRYIKICNQLAQMNIIFGRCSNSIALHH